MIIVMDSQTKMAHFDFDCENDDCGACCGDDDQDRLC